MTIVSANGSTPQRVGAKMLVFPDGLLPGTVARAGALDDVKKKGVLVVGTKADYRPFGYLDPSGKIVGLEADLAADVAKRLGVMFRPEWPPEELPQILTPSTLISRAQAPRQR